MGRMMEMTELALVQDAKMDILRGLNIKTDNEHSSCEEIYHLAKAAYYLHEMEEDIEHDLHQHEEELCARKKVMEYRHDDKKGASA